MDNLEHIFNEELELEEGIFSGAREKVKGTASRAGDTLFGSGRERRKKENELEKETQTGVTNSQIELNNDMKKTIANSLTDVKKRLYVSIVNAVQAYENANGENEAEKMTDRRFSKLAAKANTLYTDMENKLKAFYKKQLGEGTEEDWKNQQNAKKSRGGQYSKFRKEFIPDHWGKLVGGLKNPDKFTDYMKKTLDDISSKVGYAPSFGVAEKEASEKDAVARGEGGVTDKNQYNWKELTTKPKMLKYYKDNKDVMAKLPPRSQEIIKDLLSL